MAGMIVGRFDNTFSGWRRGAAEFSRAGVTRVSIEATRGYESGVVKYLRDNGFTVLFLQLLQVRAYARLRLRRAKHDPVGAMRVILILALQGMEFLRAVPKPANPVPPRSSGAGFRPEMR